MNEFQAVMGLEVLKKVETERRKRKEIKEVYHNELKDVDGITFIPESETVKSSQQYLVIRINKEEFGLSRDEVYEKLKGYNVFSRRYFYPLCSNYDCYNDLRSADKEKIPVANKVVNEVLSLPFYGDLGISVAKKISRIIKIM